MEWDGPYADTLQRFYENRSAQPVWVTTKGPTPAGQAFLTQLCQADRVGLRPSGYKLDSLAQELRALYQSPVSDVEEVRSNVGHLDVALSETFARYVDDRLHGAVSPEEVGGQWHIEAEETDLVSVMNRAVSEGVDETLDTLGVMNERHAAMHEALTRYQRIVADGGWPSIERDESLGPGDTGAAVEQLRERLAATGDLPEKQVGGATYSEAVVEAVRRFEERHGLPTDGEVSRDDLEALNVPASQRARKLALNLERYRWMPRNLGHEHVFVNLMDFRLRVSRDGEDVLSMPIVVGEQGWETVAFADTLQYAMFGPAWTVPSSIAVKELLPQLKNNPDLAEERGYHVLTREGDTVGVDSLSREALEKKRMRIQQAPGSQNPLGRVKYMFPNEHAIYLHDTPADQLFDQRVRASSHGCIRIAEPVEFGAFLFERDGMSREDIRSLMQEAEQRRVDVRDPVPVYIVYLTAWATPEGTVHFRRDRYEYDESLEAALEPPGAAAGACSTIQDVFDEMVVTDG